MKKLGILLFSLVFVANSFAQKTKQGHKNENKFRQLKQELPTPNLEFQNWVKLTFKVGIPETADKIVKHPANMDDEKSEDRFFNWCQKYLE